MKEFMPRRFTGFGERAILVEWPERIDEAILEEILCFRELVSGIPEITETIAAYHSLTLFFKDKVNPEEWQPILEGINPDSKAPLPTERRIWKIPVCYDPAFALDMEDLMEEKNLSRERIIALHTGSDYTVYAIGFLPGFMYLGGLPDVLHHPRKNTPRIKVPGGAVGIGGKQTGIYPHSSPGGWNIIGNSPIRVFNPENDPPCGIAVGDRIRFYPIDRAMFELITIRVNAGVFKLENFRIHDTRS